MPEYNSEILSRQVRNLSDYWRTDKSTYRIAELSSIMGGARSIVSLLGGKRDVTWSGAIMTSKKTGKIYLDPSILENLPTPFPGKAVDVIVGMAIHEAGHEKWTYPLGRLPEYRFASDTEKERIWRLHNILEDAYIDGNVGKISNTLSEYIWSLRSVVCPPNVGDRNNAIVDRLNKKITISDLESILVSVALFGQPIPSHASKEVSGVLADLLGRVLQYIKTKNPQKRGKLAIATWRWLSSQYPWESIQQPPRSQDDNEDDDSDDASQGKSTGGGNGESGDEDNDKPKSDDEDEGDDASGDEETDEEGDVGADDAKKANEGVKDEDDDKEDAEDDEDEDTDEDVDSVTKNGDDEDKDDEGGANRQDDSKQDEDEDEDNDNAGKDIGDGDEDEDDDEEPSDDEDDDEEPSDDEDDDEDDEVGDGIGTSQEHQGGVSTGHEEDDSGHGDVGIDQEVIDIIQQNLWGDSFPGNLGDLSTWLDAREKLPLSQEDREAWDDLMSRHMEDLTTEAGDIIHHPGPISIKDAVYSGVSESRMRIECHGEIQSIRSMFSKLDLAESRYRHGARNGKLDGKRLTKIACGKDTVFRRKEIAGRPSLAVLLMLDVSGSMTDNIADVDRTACVFHEALRGLYPRVWEESITYTGHIHSGEGVQLTRLSKSTSQLCLKDVWNGGGTPSGDALAAGVVLLKRRPEHRKMLIHFTDGAPDPQQAGKIMSVLEECDKSMIDLFTFTVGGRLSLYGDNQAYISYVSDLPDAVGKFLRKVYRR